MTAKLSTSQAELPKLVEIASRGEEVVITVEGKPKARLTRIEDDLQSRQISPMEMEQWLRDLSELRRSTSTGKKGPSVEQILEEDRADRD